MYAFIKHIKTNVFTYTYTHPISRSQEWNYSGGQQTFLNYTQGKKHKIKTQPNIKPLVEKRL